jgi:hypothetical protein
MMPDTDLEREFEHLQSSALKARLRSSAGRVANFLLAIVGTNASEGHDPLDRNRRRILGYVAEQLQMSVDTLEIQFS